MKIKIKNFNGELPDYLTVGRVYNVFSDKIHGIIFSEIFADNGKFISVNIDNCDRLNGGSWEIVNEKHED